jgi:hypothetical protein
MQCSLLSEMICTGSKPATLQGKHQPIMAWKIRSKNRK